MRDKTKPCTCACICRRPVFRTGGVEPNRCWSCINEHHRQNAILFPKKGGS